MPAKREVELKLEFPAHLLAEVSRSARDKARVMRPRQPKEMVSVYFDTDKLKLRDKGFSLRVRRIGRRFLQTIKDGGANGALLGRNEWERPVRGWRPDLAGADGAAPKALLKNKLQKGLRPSFKTRVRRTVYPVRCGDSEIELSIDNGTIRAGPQSTPVCEVELELKNGDTQQVFDLARELAEELPLQLSVQSKAQRGYGLLDGKSPKAVKMVPVALAPDLSTRAAFQAIAQACLYQLLANQPALRRTNSDALHQSRVALRRLRAAISFFSEMLGDLQTEQLKARTRWLTQELAAARELDVFIKQVVKPIATDKPDAPGMVRVATDIRRRRTRAFARAHAAVESTEFRRLVLDITAWINDGQWMRNSDVTLRALGDRPIGEAASDELRRRRKKIVKKGKRL